MEERYKDRPFIVPEEIANAVTHGMGFLLSIAALVLLVNRAIQAGTAWHIVSYTIFGSSMILLYLMSTLYHGIPKKGTRNVFRRMDHAAIFILIAGTYTPYTLTVLRGPWGWTLFGIVWGIALAGIILKTVYFKKYYKATNWVFLAMGWIIVIAIPVLIRQLPLKSLIYLFVGGGLYSIGYFFHRREKPIWSHPVWHLFVLGGTFFHFLSIMNLPV